jgi:hypothetical protein
MTKAELEYIQAACRDWLQQPGPATGRTIIPAAGPLSRPVEVERSGILTFDNVLITSAVDVETGVCYTKLIEQPDGVSEFFDTPFEKIEPGPTPTPDSEPPPMRATQKRYRDAMQRLAEERPEADRDAQAIDLTLSWIEKEKLDSDDRPKYQLYTNGELLGYSLLERAGSDGRRIGRFHPSENYFDYAHIFAALPQAENDWFEASAREAYGIREAGDDEYRKRFNELSAEADTLKFYLEDEQGLRIKTLELRLEDLSRHYDDETERWLHVAIKPA